MAAYGIIRAIVAEFPLHNAKNPSFCHVFRRNKAAARNEYGISLLWKKETFAHYKFINFEYLLRVILGLESNIVLTIFLPSKMDLIREWRI